MCVYVLLLMVGSGIGVMGLSETDIPIDFEWEPHYITPERPILLKGVAPADPFTSMDNVIVALSAGYPPFCYYAVISTRLWTRMGFRTVVFISDGEGKGACSEFYQKQILDFGGFIYRMNASKLQGPLHRHLQNSRLVACNLPGVHDNTIIVISDADTLPITRAPFDRLNPFNYSKVYWNRMDGDQTILMANIVASAVMYRRILTGLGNLGPVAPDMTVEEILSQLTHANFLADNPSKELIRDQVLISQFMQNNSGAFQQNPWINPREVSLHVNAPKGFPNFRYWILWIYVKPWASAVRAPLKEEDYTSLENWNELYLQQFKASFESDWEKLLDQAKEEIKSNRDFERFHWWTAPRAKENVPPEGIYLPKQGANKHPHSMQKVRTPPPFHKRHNTNLSQPDAPPGNPEYQEAMERFRDFFHQEAGTVAVYGSPLQDVPLASIGPKGMWNIVQGRFGFISDAHIIEVFKSIGEDCALAGQQNFHRCFGLDIGSNLGMYTLMMSEMGFRVISVEPQVDLCMSSRSSVQLNGFPAVVFCGGASPGNSTDRIRMPEGYAHGLHRSMTIPEEHHSLVPTYAPTYTIDEMIAFPPFFQHSKQPHFRIVKVDTDSIDCPMIDTLLRYVEERTMAAQNFIFEGFSCDPTTLANILARATSSGYNVYRLCMHCYSQDGRDVSADAYPSAKKAEQGPVPLPPDITVLKSQLFMREIWKFSPRSEERWLAEITGKLPWSQNQYLLSRRSEWT